MERKTKRLLDALLDYVNADEKYIVKDGFSISVVTNDVVDTPFVKELNIKFTYIDENELKRYNDEKRP